MLKCEMCGDDKSAMMQYWFEPSIKLTLCKECSNKFDPHILLKKKGSICGHLRLFGDYIESQYGRYHSHTPNECVDEPHNVTPTQVITDEFGSKVIYTNERH